jgi:hypothetical protein
MKLRIILALLLVGCATQQSNKILVAPDVVYMGAAGWTISHSPNMPKNPTDIDPLAPAKAVSGWYFDFPDKDGVHMVMVPYHANKPHKTLSITYRVSVISGTPKFVPVDPCEPNEAASFRPMLERQGDMMVASQEFYRFWGAPTKLVADGQIHTVSFPLVWDKWTGVFGKSNQGEFDAMMKNLMAVGITYGGCMGAHGDLVTGGKARFEMIACTIQ